MKVLLLTLVFFGFTNATFSQILNGKVEASGTSLKDVLVVNLSSQQETHTDTMGKFSIEGKEGDLLIFSSPLIYKKRYLIEKDDFQKEIIIPLESKPVEIEEVQIDRINFSTVELGILTKEPRKYTVEERRIYTAQTEYHIGALINLITGRTKMLKKLDAMKKEDKKVAYIQNLLGEDFIIKQAEIKKHDLNEFLYYCVYNIEEPLPQKNRANYIYQLSRKEMMFAITSLAKEYNKLKYKTIK
ncbi:MAG: hypothetical protein Q4B43_04500 [Bacteroidota bacterium]|nr:hypothetical protein [Bacteroidota bacterium]